MVTTPSSGVVISTDLLDTTALPCSKPASIFAGSSFRRWLVSWIKLPSRYSHLNIPLSTQILPGTARLQELPFAVYSTWILFPGFVQWGGTSHRAILNSHPHSKVISHISHSSHPLPQTSSSDVSLSLDGPSCIRLSRPESQHPLHSNPFLVIFSPTWSWI